MVQMFKCKNVFLYFGVWVTYFLPAFISLDLEDDLYANNDEVITR